MFAMGITSSPRDAIQLLTEVLMRQGTIAQQNQIRSWLESSYEHHLATRLVQRLEPAIMTTQGEPWRRWSLAINELSYPSRHETGKGWSYMGRPGKSGLRRVIGTLLSAAWLIDCNNETSAWTKRHRIAPTLREATEHLATHDLAAAQVAMEPRPHKLLRSLEIPSALVEPKLLASLRQLRWLLRYTQTVTGPIESYSRWETLYQDLISTSKALDPWQARIERTQLTDRQIRVDVHYRGEPIATTVLEARLDDTGDIVVGTDKKYLYQALQLPAVQGMEEPTIRLDGDLECLLRHSLEMKHALLDLLQGHHEMQAACSFSPVGLNYHMNRSIEEAIGYAHALWAMVRG